MLATKQVIIYSLVFFSTRVYLPTYAKKRTFSHAPFSSFFHSRSIAVYLQVKDLRIEQWNSSAREKFLSGEARLRSILYQLLRNSRLVFANDPEPYHMDGA